MHSILPSRQEKISLGSDWIINVKFLAPHFPESFLICLSDDGNRFIKVVKAPF